MSVLLITGSTRGIGLKVTQRLWFDDNGIDTVLLLNRDRGASESVVAALKADNPWNKTVQCYVADLSEANAVIAAATKISTEYERVDMLVNCAGFTDPQPIQQVSTRSLMDTFQVNFFSPFMIIQTLLKSGNVFSHIINVASTAGINGRSGWTAYSASKAALINFSDALREELDMFGTRVICLSPGRCATDLRKVLAPEEDPSTIMQPESVADVVSFMLSDIGRYVDTNNIVVRK